MHPPPEGAQPFIYTLLVFLHIFATMTAVGLNANYAIWIACGTRDPASLPFALRGVKFIDDYVANPLLPHRGCHRLTHDCNGQERRAIFVGSHRTLCGSNGASVWGLHSLAEPANQDA